MHDFLTTSEAAALLDVSAATLKRWATGGLVPSERTTGGHRRFRRADVERFVRSTREGDPVQAWADALSGDAGTLALQSRILDERSRLGSWWDVAESLEPVAIELHRRRGAGALTAVQWQAAFERLRRALSRLRDELPVARRGPSLLLAAVPGDRVLLSIALVELCAADAGWSTRFGGHASPDDLMEELSVRPADALLVSASLGCDPTDVLRVAGGYSSVAARLGVALGLFGVAAWPDGLEGASRVHGFARSGDAAAQDVRSWLESIRPHVQVPA